jgi:uncharacterized protein (TIGR02246 family)
MRRATCVAFAICVSTFAMAGPQDDGQAVFNKFLDDFTAANPDAIAAHFAPDALFWGTASRDLISGTSSIRQYFSDAFTRLPGAKATPVGNVSVVTVADNVMAVSGIWQLDRTVDGKTVTGQLRNSVTLVKRDGRWLIASFTNAPRPAGQ